MATETLLARTKDNHVIAFTLNYSNEAEQRRLKLECEHLCENLNCADFRSTMIRSHNISFDEANSNFLNREISGYHYRKDRARFNNGMLNEPAPQANTLSFSYRMDDSFFPEVIKNLGFIIKPLDRTFDVYYDPATRQYEVQNFVRTTATVNSGKRELEIVRRHFKFPPADYRRLQRLQAEFAHAKAGNPRLTESEYAQNNLTDERDRKLFWFYAQKKENVDHLDTTLAHELKHIKNAVFKDGLALKKSSKRLSVDNYYRVAVEDERSAYLEELVQNINTYLQRGDYDDFSMFYVNNDDIARELRRLRTPAERLAYAQNWPQLVASKMQYFENNHRKSYDYGPENAVLNADDFDADGDSKLRQFLQNTKNYIKQAPLSEPEDVDGAEFRKLRSLFYNYQIYNPTTRRMESVNLAQYITPDLEVRIDDQIRSEVIEPQQSRLNDRLREYVAQRTAGTINPALVEPAKALMRGGVYNSTFINEIDNFRISSLYEPENTSSPTPIPPSTSAPIPEPEPIPDDHADWSNNLQTYWQNMDGYQEIAKNNNEYKFKVNDATVRYTSDKDVQISKNADYELYVKLLKEPGTQGSPIEFLDTLSREQALMLYVACINNGRTMTGAVPTDLAGIENLQGISPAEMNKFRYRTQNGPTQAQHEHQVAPMQKLSPMRRREQNTH